MLGNAQDTVYGDPAYHTQVEYLLPGITPIIQTSAAPGEDWISTLARIGSAIVMTQQQRDLMEIQMQRARAGLPPLDMAAYSGLGVSLGVSAATKQMILVGIGMLAAVWLGTSVFKHR
jgi:hypothetical protein